MNDRNLVRGLFLMAISLTFGLASLRYQTGDFSRAGPGLFPLMVAGQIGFAGAVSMAIDMSRANLNARISRDRNALETSLEQAALT